MPWSTPPRRFSSVAYLAVEATDKPSRARTPLLRRIKTKLRAAKHGTSKGAPALPWGHSRHLLPRFSRATKHQHPWPRTTARDILDAREQKSVYLFPVREARSCSSRHLRRHRHRHLRRLLQTEVALILGGFPFVCNRGYKYLREPARRFSDRIA